MGCYSEDYKRLRGMNMMIEINGKRISGDSSKEILSGIRDSNAFTESLTLGDYLKGLRRRLFKATGVIVPAGDYDGFIKVMQDNHIIEVIES